MKKVVKIGLFVLLVGSLALTSCSSSKKSQCGCPNRQGMVGY
jgi:hypothetical protein